MNRNRNPKTIKRLAGLMILVTSLVLFELPSYVSFESGLDDQGVFRGVVPLSREKFDNYLFERDAILGWPTKTALEICHEGSGFRRSSASAKIGDADGPCPAVYGESYTIGDEVSAEEAWSNQMTEIPGRKVLLIVAAVKYDIARINAHRFSRHCSVIDIVCSRL